MMKLKIVKKVYQNFMVSLLHKLLTLRYLKKPLPILCQNFNNFKLFNYTNFLVKLLQDFFQTQERKKQTRQQLLSKVLKMSDARLRDPQIVYEQDIPMVFFQIFDHKYIQELQQTFKKYVPAYQLKNVTVKYLRSPKEGFQTIFIKGLKPDITQRQLLSILRSSGFCYPQMAPTYKIQSSIKCADIYFTSQIHGKQFIKNYNHYPPFIATFNQKPYVNIKVDKSTLKKIGNLPPPFKLQQKIKNQLPTPMLGMPGLAGLAFATQNLHVGSGMMPLQYPMTGFPNAPTNLMNQQNQLQKKQ